MNTKELIKSMLLENTGAHFLDSGGSNGRSWQRNQGHDFDKDERVTAEFYNGELEYCTVSLYHYLCEVLELDDLAEEINEIIKNSDAHWVQEAVDVVKLADYKSGLYIFENIKGPENVYNYENNVSQIFQFMTFIVNDEPYVLLQIHGGADVRGGYTDTKCFKLIGYLTGQVDMCGSINGTDISNSYNGYSLTDESGNEIEIKESDELNIDFYVMDETYIYNE